MKHLKLYTNLMTVLMLLAFSFQMSAQDVPDQLYDPLENFDLMESYTDSVELSAADADYYAWEIDSFRLKRTTLDKQEMVWKVNDITNFHVLIAAFHFRKDPNYITFSVSKNGNIYNTIEDVEFVSYGKPWNWAPMVASASFPSDNYQYLKIEIEGSWKDDKVFTPQFSSVHINYPDTTTFTAGDDNSWSTEGNWSNGVPSYYSNAIIDAGEEATINADVVSKNVHLNNGAKLTLEDTLHIINNLYTINLQADGESLGEIVNNNDPSFLSLFGNHMQPVVGILNTDYSFSDLLGAVDDAGLTEVLSSEGTFNLFAPNNDAFEKMDADKKDSIMNDTDALANVLKHHILDLDTLVESLGDLQDSIYVKTMVGDSVFFRRDTNGNTFIDDAMAEAIAGNVGTNGVVYSLDSVLIPSYIDTSDTPSSIASNNIETNAVQVYPNPASNFVTLEYNTKEAENVSIQLFNILGKQVMNLNLGTANVGINRHQLKVNDMESGIYILRLNVGNYSENQRLYIR